ncbi:pyridoxamine 5'-phosphate oxidase-domain-containing protein [Hypoxylon sp. FL1857]|nr:pyridoxamine 5'-phosphate oxidase-domain-containing protein [Hypoxylon sp. FL1857]
MHRFARCSGVSASRPALLTTPHLHPSSLSCRTMATASSTLGPAPWRKSFLEHLKAMASIEFTLGTVRKIASKNGTVYVPRARTCAFRGMFAELAAHPDNTAELNPDLYESDLLTFTTDRRMDKAAELFGVETDGTYGDADDERVKGTGGGAPVEAVFWVKEKATQWRFRGRAYVLAPDVDTSEEGKRVVATLTERMRRKNSDSDSGSSGKEWGFSREITAHFGNTSPLMRGSFRNPPPGVPVAVPVDDGRLKLGQELTDLNDALARSNFRLVVIVPEELDCVDLNDPARSLRWQYTFVGNKSEPTAPGGVIEDGWEKVEVWP